MMRRDLLRRAVALPFIGGALQVIAARPQTVQWDTLKRSIEWCSQMGWRLELYTERVDETGWYAWVTDAAGKHVGWLSTTGRFLPK
jgi:hypothetical protein